MARTRFAPSPTGHLHIGGIRTALYAYALAKKTNGEFLLRIEDTDRTRFVPGAEEEIMRMLKAYHILPDEDPFNGGPYGPYRQSERLHIYREHAEKLIEMGHAYYCFVTAEELDEKRKLAQANKEIFIFRSPYRDMPLEESKKLISEGKPFVIRQKTPLNEVVVFEDPIQGKIEFNTKDVDDTVLLKSDGFPTYHLAVVVDDHLMQITHALRAVEWLPSTPKHLLLYKAFGWEVPVIAHLSLILDPEGGKLSKRKGSTSAEEFLNEGYIPEAMLNFLMLLGWSSPEVRTHGEKEREVFSLDEFVDLFDIKNLNKASPVFNREKLLWFNQQYIQTMQLDELSNRFTTWLEITNQQDSALAKNIIQKGPDYLQKILVLVRERVRILSEIPGMINFLYERGEKQDLTKIDKLKKFDFKLLPVVLKEFTESLADYPEDFAGWEHENWEQSVRSIAEKHDIIAGNLFMLLRIVITEAPVSPPLYESILLLGKKETLARIQNYL